MLMKEMEILNIHARTVDGLTKVCGVVIILKICINVPEKVRSRPYIFVTRSCFPKTRLKN